MKYFTKPKSTSLVIMKGLLCLTVLFAGLSLKSTAQVVSSESFDGPTFVPTGWTEFTTDNSGAYWQPSPGGDGNPFQSTHSGAGQARFDSYDYQTGEDALITPAYDLSGACGATATVSFWMYRDSGYPGTLDELDVYMNTAANLTGASYLGTIYRDVNSAPIEGGGDGWYQYTFNVPSGFTGTTNYLVLDAISQYGNDIFIDDVQWDSYPAPPSPINYSESFDGATFVPTGWTELVTSPSATWIAASAGIYPTQAPHSGAGEARFTSYSFSTGEDALITPSFDLSARGCSTTPTVSFWMYRDGGYPSNADKLDVYVNTAVSLTGATLLGTINRASDLAPVVGSDGWYQYTFNIPSSYNGALNYLVFDATSNFGNDIYLDDIQWQAYSNACFGAPTPGNTVASANPVCLGSNVTLSLQTAVAGSGITYQWQSSADGITYADVTGATSPSLVTTQSTDTYYQCIVTCTSGPSSTTSTPLLVTMNAPTNCYCTPTNSTYNCTYDWISNVTLGTINNTTGCNSPWTLYPASGSTTTTLTAGVPYSMSLSVAGYSGYFTVWIDEDQNGIFDASEIVVNNLAVGPITSFGNYTGTTTLTVPGTALSGNTRMRVRQDYDFTVNDPCAALYEGETEDYIVTIAPQAACAGAPAPGNTISTDTTICASVNFTLSLQNIITTSGITYQWQSSPDGVTYSDIAGATASTLTTTQSSATYYQCNVTCNAGPTTTTSTPLFVNLSVGAPCLTYCNSSANFTSDEEIYSVTVNGATNAYGCTTVAPGPGSILNRYSNFFPLGSLTSMMQGTTIPFTILEDECDGPTYYANGCAVWIDWNHNGSFTDPGEQVYIENTTTVSPRTITGSFTVPFSALPGQAAMRIVVAEAYSGASLTPCLSYGYGETEDYIVNVLLAPPCAGTPNPGNTVSTDNPVCATTVFTLSTQNFTTGSAVTYQWQSSPDGVTYTNMLGDSAATVSLTQNTDTYYRCIVTCNAGPSSDTSAALQVTMNSIANCYCTSPVYSFTSGCSYNIFVSNFQFGGINNTTTCNGVDPYYTYYNALTANVAQGSNYPISVSSPGTPIYIMYFKVYIDYNDNGSFDDAGELVYNSGNLGNVSNISNGSVLIPVTAPLGTHRMRVRCADQDVNSCTEDGIVGETEDYNITIVPPSYDMGVASFITPTSPECYSSAETITVAVTNYGALAIDLTVNNVTVNCSVAGPNPTTFSPVVLDTGSIAPGATMVVTVATNYNMAASGTYDYTSSTSVTNDVSSANDTARASFIKINPPSVTAVPDMVGICPGASTGIQAIPGPSNSSTIISVANSNVLSIPDATPAGVTSTIVANGAMNANTLISCTIDATHTYDGDLIFRLIAPNGSSITLSNREGAGGDNFTNTIFVASGGTPIASGSAPFTGGYAPENPFSNFTGSGSGTWTLFVSDNAGGDVGTVNFWSIKIPALGGIATYSWTPATGLSSTNDPYPSATPASTMIYNVTVVDNAGCSGSDTAMVTVFPLAVTPITTDAVICAGTSTTLVSSGTTGIVGWYDASNAYVGGGSSFTTPILNTSAIYFVQDSSAIGCNVSTQNIVSVIVNPVSVGNQSFLLLCPGNTVTVGTNVHSTAGTFTDVLTNWIGCDSTVTTVMTYKTPVTYSQTLTLCAGASVTVGTTTHDTTGTFVDVLPGAAANSCDSTVTTNLTIRPAVIYNQAFTLCPGSTVTVGATTHNATGIFTDVLTGAASTGCDSTVVTDLTILAPVVNNQSISLCFGGTTTVGANTYDTTGVYTDVFIAAAANGCDSTVITTLTIRPAVMYSQTLTLCAGSMVMVGTTMHDTTGVFTDVLPNVSSLGCDSTVITNLTIRPAVVYSQAITKCAGDSLTVGIHTYHTSGTYTDVLTGASSFGCDSTVTTNLTVLPAAVGSQTLSRCQGQSVVVGTHTYTTSGTFTDVLPAASAAGCDSTVTTILTVHPLPVVNLASVQSPICMQAAPVTLVGTPTGGIYSGRGVTGSTFSPSVPGAGLDTISYSVTDVNSCSNSTSQFITIQNCNGIDEYAFGNTVSVYPNPTNGMFNVSISNATFNELLITIVDVEGREVYTSRDKNISSSYNKEIHLESLAKGVYYIKLSNGTDLKVEKLVIQ